MSQCATCGRFVSGDDILAHRCPPSWEVWSPDLGASREDAHVVHADDAEGAAVAWAKWWDQDDYDIVGGEEYTVHVCREGGSDVTTWTVYGQSVPEYWARRAP